MAAKSFGNDAHFQDNLIDFLNTEMDLGFTFCRDAQTQLEAKDPDHYVLLLEKAGTSLETVRRFEERIADPELWRRIHERADRLENLISRSGDFSLS